MFTKKVKRKKYRFDDNKFVRMHSFICHFSALFMKFGISEIYSPIDQGLRVRVAAKMTGMSE